MGIIEIDDGEEEEAVEAPDWEGRVTIARDPPRIVVTPSAPFRELLVRPADRDRDPGPPALARPLPVATPALLTLAYAVLGVVAGFTVFDPARPGPPRLVAYALLVPYYLVCLGGTLLLADEVRRLRAARPDWPVAAWVYPVLGGLLLALLAPPQPVRGPITGDLAALLLGRFIVAAPLSSVVAGPIHLLLRRLLSPRDPG